MAATRTATERHTTSLPRHPLAAALLLALPALASAQPADEEALAELDTVVVVGALTDEVLDRAQIERTQANDLADLFRNVPSVQVGGGVGLAHFKSGRFIRLRAWPRGFPAQRHR